MNVAQKLSVRNIHADLVDNKDCSSSNFFNCIYVKCQSTTPVQNVGWVLCGFMTLINRVSRVKFLSKCPTTFSVQLLAVDVVVSALGFSESNEEQLFPHPATSLKGSCCVHHQ